MGFLDKAKSAAEQAAHKAKEGAEFAAQKAKETAEDVQTKRELGNAYDELGHKAFELVESGAISHGDARAARGEDPGAAGEARRAGEDREEAGTPRRRPPSASVPASGAGSTPAAARGTATSSTA